MSMVLIYATSNGGKVASLRRKLPDVEIKQKEYDFVESRTFNVEEIAKEKVMFAYRDIAFYKNMPHDHDHLKKKEDWGVIANDAGFSIAALNDWPESFINFELKKLGIEGFLKLMEGVEDRRAEFRHSLAYMSPQLQEPIVFSDSIKGSVAYCAMGERQEHHWSDLSRIFIPQNMDRTLAQLSQEQYHHVRELSKSEPSCSEVFADNYEVLQALEVCRSERGFPCDPAGNPCRKDSGWRHPNKRY